MTPDEMVDKLLDPFSDTNDGVVVNNLLDEFWRGYPIENLRRLLVPATIGNAAFLVSELGQRIRPLIREVADLLEDETPRVRGDAISALAQCTTWEDGWAVAKVIKAIGDPHDGVRRTACNALRYMESSKMRAGLEYLRLHEPASVFSTFRNAFLAIESQPRKAIATIEKLLHSDDPVARRFGAAMIVRPRLYIDPAFVALSASVEDTEVAEWVEDATKAPLPPWAKWEGPLKRTDENA